MSKQTSKKSRMGIFGYLRWFWRQLTTMRSALFLLLLLAVAAIPGSIFPQRSINPEAVDKYIEDNGTWGKILDHLQMFDVYKSVWFSAIYILLFISLIGCVIPRAIHHFKAAKQPPPKTPRNFARLPVHGEVVLENSEALSNKELIAQVQSDLKKRHYRTKIYGDNDSFPAQSASKTKNADSDVSEVSRQEPEIIQLASSEVTSSPPVETIDVAKASTENADAFSAGKNLETVKTSQSTQESSVDFSVSAETGMLKEVGNLIFHISLIGVLIFSAISTLFGYSGQAVIVEGDSFVNNRAAYDKFEEGTNFSDEHLQPFRLKLNNFDIEYDMAPDKLGQPIYFNADMNVQDKPGEKTHKEQLQVNKPIHVGGESVYLVGNGYAPEVTVRDGKGNISYKGAVISPPTNPTMMDSQFVLKVPDSEPDQLGFLGFFFPTVGYTTDGAATSRYPDVLSNESAELQLNSYYGDLGLDKGPQNVFELDVSHMKELNSRKSKDGGIKLKPNQTYKLPQGKGSIRFDGIKRFIAVDIAYVPAQDMLLTCVIIGIIGLIGSLYINRRRAWVKIKSREGNQVTLEYGLLSRGDDFRLNREAEKIEETLKDIK